MRLKVMLDFPPRKRVARVIPFGYKVSEHDPKWLEPVPSQIQALQQAFEFLMSCSYSEVAKWLTHTTGRPISEVGLFKIFKKLKKKRAQRYEQTRQDSIKRRRIIERDFQTSSEEAEALPTQSSNQGEVGAGGD